MLAGRLLRDPYAVASAALLGAWAALYALPAVPADFKVAIGANYIELPFVALAFAALGAAIVRGPRDERRFWIGLLVGYACYASTFPSYHQHVPARWHGLVDLAEELLNLGFYAAILIAIALRPQLGRRGIENRTARLELSASLLFLFVLLAYFVAVPGVSPRTATAVPALVLYVVLDLVVVLALLAERRAAADRAWRGALGLLALSSGLWLALNVVEMLFHWKLLAVPKSGSTIDLLWLVQYPPLVLAPRLLARAARPARERRRPLEPGPQQARGSTGALIVAFLAAIPVVHYGTHATGFLDPADRPMRELLVMAGLVGLGAIGFAHQRAVGIYERELLEQVRRSQKMEAVGRLAGGVAHDFNNLMTVVSGHASLLLDQIGPREPGRASLEAIQAAGARAAELTRQLLALGRPVPATVVALDLNEVVRGVSRLLERVVGERIRVVVDLDPALAPTRGDRGLLEQVLMNLVVNACDAMPDGGVLTVRTRAVAPAGDGASGDALAVHGAVVLEVGDTGHGMDEATLERAFEPFFTTKDPTRGNGLGLAIVYGIVHQLEGAVEATSRPGAGTTMRVLLPRAAGAMAAPAVRGNAPVRRTRGEEVLLVEDQDSVRDVVARMLLELGYRVRTAASAAEAREALATEPAPALVLTDIVMPGDSGLALAEAVRRERPGVRIVLMTGYSDSPIAPEWPVLGKPFTLEDLAGVLDRALGPPHSPERGAAGDDPPPAPAPPDGSVARNPH